jgi:hypothetical protein
VVNGTVGLLRASGSLFIDVFDRHGFTADANAMLIGLLEDFAEAELVVGNASAHKHLLDEAHALRSAMEKLLWASSAAGASTVVGRGGDDHFVTAMLDDEHSFYDMVDYDANLIAVVSAIYCVTTSITRRLTAPAFDKHTYLASRPLVVRLTEHQRTTPSHDACSHVLTEATALPCVALGRSLFLKAATTATILPETALKATGAAWVE